MIAAITAALPLPGNPGGAPDSSLRRSDNDSLCLALSKPIWIVRTEITVPCASASRLMYSMIAAISAALPLPGNSGGAPHSSLRRSDNDSLCISLSKPIWIVRTESNVRKENIKKSDPPCVVCSGSGRVDCRHCEGRGRTNYVNLPMLPKGEWPRWCKVCGGSGLGYCNRCLGTGEYRDIMGFHFMKMDTNSSRY